MGESRRDLVGTGRAAMAFLDYIGFPSHVYVCIYKTVIFCLLLAVLNLV
jgi:hypothetical protein